MLTEQNTTHEEDRRTTSFENTRRSMEGNKHQHYWPITKIQWKECDCSYCRPIYKDDLTQSDNDKCVIRRDCKDLPRWNMEITQDSKSYSQW